MSALDPLRRARCAALVLPLALALGAAGCGDDTPGPSVASSGAAGAAGALPAGHPPTGGLPAGHPPTGAAGQPAVLSGTIELAGTLAGLEQGFVFAIGREPASGRMVLVEKLALADARAAGDGVRELDFALATAHALEGGAVAEVELEVRIDRDGLADGDDDVLARATLPARIGDSGLRIVLDDATRTTVPLER